MKRGMMMRFNIPGYGTLMIEHVAIDFNGTIAVDGVIGEAVKKRIVRLAERCRLHVLTSDTRGTVARELAGLPMALQVYDSDNAGESKRLFVKGLGGTVCACIGNGKNDLPMFKEAALAVAVLESEGLYAPLLAAADLLVKSSEDALELLLDETRLVSVLRG